MNCRHLAGVNAHLGAKAQRARVQHVVANTFGVDGGSDACNWGINIGISARQYDSCCCKISSKTVPWQVQVKLVVQRAKGQAFHTGCSGQVVHGHQALGGFNQGQQGAGCAQGLAHTGQLKHRFALGQHDSGQAQGAQRGQIVLKPRALCVVDADQHAWALGILQRGDPLAYVGAGAGFVCRGHGVFQVQDDAVCACGEGLVEPLGTVARHKQVAQRGAHIALAARRPAMWSTL